jgi:hypothetical protein
MGPTSYNSLGCGIDPPKDGIKKEQAQARRKKEMIGFIHYPILLCVRCLN